MSADLPTFEPFMLRCLTYGEALQSMRHTGCAIRRHHWCSPVVVYEGTQLIFDNEDQRDPWKPTREDRAARDWEMTPHPEATRSLIRASPADRLALPRDDQTQPSKAK